MKYSRLSKDQFVELHKEFIDFLSSNSITDKDWNILKENNDGKAEGILDLFSDIVWAKVLDKTQFLENISKNHIYLFSFDKSLMKFIAIYTENAEIDFTTNDGFSWLRNNLFDDSVKIYNSSKNFSEDKLADKFDLIKKGGVITKGELFNYFDELIIA
jgi:cag pathogenicity island protein 24